MRSQLHVFLASIQIPEVIMPVAADRVAFDGLQDADKKSVRAIWRAEMQAALGKKRLEKWWNRMSVCVTVDDDVLAPHKSYLFAMDRLDRVVMDAVQGDDGPVVPVWSNSTDEQGCTSCPPPRGCHSSGKFLVRYDEHKGPVDVAVSATHKDSNYEACIQLEYRVWETQG